MTLGEWIEDEIEGTMRRSPWNPPRPEEYRQGYLDALEEVRSRLTRQSSHCPLLESD